MVNQFYAFKSRTLLLKNIEKERWYKNSTDVQVNFMLVYVFSYLLRHAGCPESIQFDHGYCGCTHNVHVSIEKRFQFVGRRVGS